MRTSSTRTITAAYVLTITLLANTAAATDAATPAESITAGDHEYRAAGVNAQGYREFLRLRDGATVVLIPGGHFHQRGYWDVPGTTMKDDRSWVYLPPMLYDKYEVTNRQVVKFLQAAGGVLYSDGKAEHFDGHPYASAHAWGLDITEAGARARAGFEDFPAVGTSGWLAVAYAAWVGGKLPNGLEFEKAASGPSGLLFPWGNEDKLPDSTRANNYLHGPKRTVRVGNYPAGASPWGLLDMSGNVYERAYWDGTQSADPALPTRQPTMLKGGGWVSPNWSNMRCVDRCGQDMDLMEGSVGFRVCITDPEVLQHFAVAKPKLRIFTDALDAYEEASERNVPIFLYMGYERCGQCDRVQAQLFQDPQFIDYCNQHLVVLIGHCTRDSIDMPKTPVTDDGIFFAHSGVPLEDIQQVWWDFSMWRVAHYVRLPDSVPLFQISPGLFLLNPYREQVRNPDDAVLIDDQRFMRHKGGLEVPFYLDRFREAQAKLGVGLTLQQYQDGAEAPPTDWRPTPEDAKLWRTALDRMQTLRAALQQFAADNGGRYPEGLEALRSLLRHGWLPQDPFRGEYFRYELTTSGFRLVCHGRGDQVGGEMIPERDIVCTESMAPSPAPSRE
ncbi:MAG: SUMF1/EgtB/PvdO family nonheme iron enzyme [Planctomycetota bacterium]